MVRRNPDGRWSGPPLPRWASSGGGGASVTDAPPPLPPSSGRRTRAAHRDSAEHPLLLNLTSDQEFLRDTTTKFLADRASVAQVRGLRDDPVGFDAQYWRRGAELGWTSLLVSEQQGGGSISGDGLIDLTLIAHEFGGHAAPGPLVPTNLVAAALSNHPGGHHDELLAGSLGGNVDRIMVLRRTSPPRPSGTHRPRGAGRGCRGRPRRGQATGRVGRSGVPPAGHRADRRGSHPGDRPRRRPRPGRSPHALGGSHPSLPRAHLPRGAGP